MLGVFHRDLSEEVQDELAVRDWARSLDELINLAICLDDHLCQRRRERAAHQTP